MILRILIGAVVGAGLGFGWYKLVGCSHRRLPVDKQSGHQHALRHGRGCIDRGQFSLNLNQTNPIMKMQLIIRRFAGIVHPGQPVARALPQPLLALGHRLCRLQPAAIVVHEILSAGNHFEKTRRRRLVLRKLRRANRLTAAGDAGHKA